MKKLRLLVLTDISTTDAVHGEPDDTQSLVRLLLYGDQFDIVGLVATYTVHLGKAEPEFLRHVIRGYESAYPNLCKAGEFMTPAALHAAVRHGDDQCGTERIARLSEGAAHILDCANASEEPLWIAAWGGVTDLAQALRHAEETCAPEIFEKLLAKLRVCSIGDQYDECGPWIRRRYPNLFYITAFDSYRGMYRCGDLSLTTPEWLCANITDACPYGSHYPIYDGGDALMRFFGKVRGVKEGDTPSFLYLIQNGLGDPMRPEYGNWGGRFAQVPGTRHYLDACDYMPENAGPWAGVYRWRRDAQEDFAARMALAAGRIASLDYPSFEYKGDTAVLPGEKASLLLDHSAATDIRWMVYSEAGTYRGVVLLENEPDAAAFPSKVQKGVAHLICVAENRTAHGYVFRRYKRALITVE